jgi:hypothetical protein
MVSCLLGGIIDTKIKKGLSMRNILKALFVVLIFCLLIIRPAVSYADWKDHSSPQNSPQSSSHSSGGHSSSYGSGHGSGHSDGHGYGHGYGYSSVGINLGVWPAGYYYDGPYYPTDDTVLISSPIYPPVVITQSMPQAPVITGTPIVEDTQDTYIVNIPNDKGGYTAVILKRSGKGFIGPQGEYYPEFPKVRLLRLMYGK